MHVARLSGLVAASAAASVVATGSWAGGVPTRLFVDASGDSGAAADITGVAVSYESGSLAFDVSISDRETLLPADSVAVALDSDNSRSTGGDGLDYAAILTGGGEVLFYRWNGEDLAPAPAPARLRGAFASGQVHIAIPRASVGSRVRFRFTVATAWEAEDEVELDIAPENGYWSYSMVGRLLSLHAAFVHHGRTVALEPGSVRVGTSSGLAVRPDSIVCRAAIRERSISPQSACAWRIPRWAAGRPIDVSITVRVSDQRRTFVRSIPSW